MPVLQEELGTYDGRCIIRLFGSFGVDGSGDPEVIRDGKRNSFSVVHDGAGLYTVTFSGTHPVPELLITEDAWLSKAAVVAKAQTCNVVADSWSQADREFQIVVVTVGDVAGSAYADPALSDPADGERINFELVGSISPAGTDAA